MGFASHTIAVAEATRTPACPNSAFKAAVGLLSQVFQELGAQRAL